MVLSSKEQITASAEQARKIVDTLNTLLHYPEDFKEFPKEYLELIGRRGQQASCALHLHPNQSCVSYAVSKTKRSLVQGMKISALFIALPAALQSVRKLREDPSAWKVILVKFVRSAIYLALINGLPVMLVCQAMKFGLRPGKRLWFFNALVGSIFAYAVEPSERHIQILSYLGPKVIETLTNILERKLIYKSKSWHTHATFFVAWALISMFMLSDYRKKK